MSRGIVFYICGNGINHQFVPALYSLRQHYTGDIGLVHAPNVNKDFLGQLQQQGVQLVADTVTPGHKIDMWIRKMQHHKLLYPFDTNLYYDTDHLWVDKFDTAVFDMIEDKGLAACTDGKPPMYRGHLKKLSMEHLLCRKLPEIVAVNGGCTGAVKNHELLDDWAEMTERCQKSYTEMAQNPEEFGLAMLASQGTVGRIDPRWSRLMGKRQMHRGRIPRSLPPTIALHGQLGNYSMIPEWRKVFWACWDKDYMCIQSRYKDLYKIRSWPLKTVLDERNLYEDGIKLDNALQPAVHELQ